MKHIGLTGSIGAGKSTVSNRLRELGAYVLDADIAAREVVLPGTAGLARVTEEFGTEILREDGSLDRAALAAVVFADPKKRYALNQIIHPLIGQWFQMRIEEIYKLDPEAVVIHDVPLLFEANMHEGLDEIWVVVASDDMRLSRIMERDNCTAQQALNRMRAQMPQEEKMKRADYIIDNSGDRSSLIKQVDALFARFK